MDTSNKAKRIGRWIIGIVIVILLCVYVVGAFYYRDKFFPETKINGINFRNTEVSDVMNTLETQLQNYKVEIRGRNLHTDENTMLFEITSKDIDLLFAVESAEVEALLNKQNSFLWPVLIWRNYDYQLNGGVSYNKDKLIAFLEAQEVFQEENTEAPADAYLREKASEPGTLEIVPEIYGNRLDKELAVNCISTAISQSTELVNLEEQKCYMEPTVLASSGDMQQMVEQAEKWMQSKITYDWNNHEVLLDKELIKNWIIFENGQLTINREAVAEFVAENAAQYDTYGKSRAFHTTLGYDLMLPSGYFGWLTDREAETDELITLIKSGAVCEREPIYASKAPWKGMNDIGNSYVEIDLTHQHLYLYQSGNLVLETDFVSGNMSKGYNTPEGVFGVAYKTTNATLRGGDYAEHVNYWMPYYGNYGMHDATWRTEFGGDIFMEDGSHGCINLPLDKAGEIYQQISEGFPVICYYYPPGMLPEQEYDDDEDDE